MVEDDRAAADGQALSDSERDRAVTGYNRWAGGLRTVRGGGRARVGSDDERPRAFDFSIVVARPQRARLQGRWSSLASLFDLSGDGSGWTLYLPRDRSVVRTEDTAASAGLLLPPVEIVSVLLPAGIPPVDLVREGAWSREQGLARVVVPPGRGGAGSSFHRVLWIDPEEGIPRRIEIRRSSQLEDPLLVAEYVRYEGDGAKAFPIEIRISMATAGQWASFTFNTVRINDDVDDALFAIRVPPGTREIAPGELNPDFLPLEEDP